MTHPRSAWPCRRTAGTGRSSTSRTGRRSRRARRRCCMASGGSGVSIQTHWDLTRRQTSGAARRGGDGAKRRDRRMGSTRLRPLAIATLRRLASPHPPQRGTHVIWKQPGHLTSMKNDLGCWTSVLSLCLRSSDSIEGLRRSTARTWGRGATGDVLARCSGNK